MTELTFTKTFLSTLDSRPLKLQSDYVANPKTLELHVPYTLPRMPNPMRRPSSTSQISPSDPSTSSTKPAPTSTAQITLKSTRNPPLQLQLEEIDPSGTSILDLKERVAKEIGMEGKIEKIKILWARKPVSDAKTVKEAVGDDAGLKEGKLEFGVMVMGYVAPAPAAAAAPAADAGGDEKGNAADKMDVDTPGIDEALGGEAFWGDLKGFLQQRLKNEGLAGEVLGCFQEAWRKR